MRNHRSDSTPKSAGYWQATPGHAQVSGMMISEAMCMIDLVILYTFLPRSTPSLALHWLDAQAKNAKVTLADSDQATWWLAHEIAQSHIKVCVDQQCNSFAVLHT
ncbi:TPA: hypothetical protein ACH3X2_002512 [Trebouxia sp. C0005]